MKANLSPKRQAEFQKWLNEYLAIFEKNQNISALPYPEQIKLLQNRHPFIRAELIKKGMSPAMRDMLDTYVETLIKICQ